MDREAALRVKRVRDHHNEELSSILAGLVASATVEAQGSPPSLEERYDELVGKLRRVTQFFPDQVAGWWTTDAVTINFADEGPLPKLQLRFRWWEELSGARPATIIAEWSHVPEGCSRHFEDASDDFAGSSGQVLATECVSWNEMPTDSPYRGSLLPGSDPRSPEDRMLLIHQSYDEFLAAL